MKKLMELNKYIILSVITIIIAITASLFWILNMNVDSKITALVQVERSGAQIIIENKDINKVVKSDSLVMNIEDQYFSVQMGQLNLDSDNRYISNIYFNQEMDLVPGSFVEVSLITDSKKLYEILL